MTTLIDGIDALNGSRRAVVTQLTEEESAKVLVLLDILRAGRRDQKAINRLTEAFYSRLARGIYADVVQMRPATFGETHKLVDFRCANRTISTAQTTSIGYSETRCFNAKNYPIAVTVTWRVLSFLTAF